MGTRILVPTDGSAQSEQAIEYALTTFSDAEFVVFHVLDPSERFSGDAAIEYDRIDELLETDDHESLERAKELAERHDRTITVETRIGSPATKIVEFTEANEIDQIVIGSRGRSGLARVLLGSVAETVVRRAPVPVTVVR